LKNESYIHEIIKKAPRELKVKWNDQIIIGAKTIREKYTRALTE
jgi:hypothetical protein